jgi:hypothetical protein
MKYGGSPVNGVTRWTGQPKTSVQFTPGRAKGGASRILAMRFTGGTRAGGVLVLITLSSQVPLGDQAHVLQGV